MGVSLNQTLIFGVPDPVETLPDVSVSDGFVLQPLGSRIGPSHNVVQDEPSAFTLSQSRDTEGGAGSEAVVSQSQATGEEMTEDRFTGMPDNSIHVSEGMVTFLSEPPTPSKLNPKAALKEYYDQCEPRIILTKGSFVSIMDNTAGDHMPLFTSIFVCPHTGEIFLAGSLLNQQYGGHTIVVANNMAWYKTKANSQFAAAGRALDCFHTRKNTCNQEVFCADAPYHSTEFAVTLHHLEEHYHVTRSEISKVKDLQSKAYRSEAG